MKDRNRTKEQLVDELAALRLRVSELETSEIELKRTQEKLLQSEKKWRLLYEDLPGGSFAVNNRYIITDVNDVLCAITGFTKEELIGKKCDIICPKGPHKCPIFDLGKDRIDNDETAVKSKDGRLVPIIKSARRIPLNDMEFIVENFLNITERKRVEKELKEAHEQQEATLNALPDLMFEIDRDGHIYDYRAPHLALLYVAPEKFLNHNLNDILPDEASIIIMDAIDRALETGKRTVAVYSLETPKGKGTFELSLVVKGDSKDQDSRFIALIRDITERKRSEDEILYLKKYNENIVNHMIDPIVIIDRDYQIVFQNIPSLNKYGDGINEKCYEFYYDRKEPCDFCTAVHCIKEKEILISEVQMKDGSYLEIHTSPILMPDNSYCSLEILRDITERKQAEEALQESEEKFRSFFETSKDVIFIVTIDGKFSDINSAAEKLFGYTGEELMEIDITDLYVDKRMVNVGMKLLRDKSFFQDLEVSFKKKDGTIINCLVTTTLRKEKDGNIIGYQGIIRDITDKKRLEEQVLAVQKMEAVGALAGGMAHNFNNILVGIMGYSEYLYFKKNEDDPDYKALKVIYEGTLRASELIKQLLNTTRVEKFKTTKASLNDIVNRILPLVTGTFDTSIEIETTLKKDLMVMEGNSGQLEQCLLNLCINARDAMSGKGKLLVETFNQYLDDNFLKTHIGAKKGDYVVLSVTDTGKGIAPEVKERIFEPFFSTKDEKGGTGMGLSTVYGIVNNHGGLITVYSEVGKGSTFKLYFPAIEGATKEVISTVERMELKGSETVLIIDDEPIVKDMWGDYLHDAGYRVLLAEDGGEGIEIFSRMKDEIDIVILDFVMPRLGGEEMLKKLKEIDPNVKVLFTSGYSENGQAKEIIRKNANGFIQKPAQLEKLGQKIRSILDDK